MYQNLVALIDLYNTQIAIPEGKEVISEYVVTDGSIN